MISAHAAHGLPSLTPLWHFSTGLFPGLLERKAERCLKRAGKFQRPGPALKEPVNHVQRLASRTTRETTPRRAKTEVATENVILPM